ncbi:zinc finger protein weckle-like isoform X1 [Drosophila ficusphila]|uniref:zinc finger protein weckle-like isoform X1 n=1 Tax=Drosophila ficusphila TaxID=30025 RepID=UPI001C8AE172|nr:zinc finger protein weckle-like isoform X1 [Drosophila ficusphila]
MTECSHWLAWCRLCAKDDAHGNVQVQIGENGQRTWDNVLIIAIHKYFEVHMRLEDELSIVLCTECYTLISKLINFTEHVTKVQAIFDVLRRAEMVPNKQLDVPALRQQYGLAEDDWTHIIKPVEAPKINSALEAAEIQQYQTKVLQESPIADQTKLDLQEPETEMVFHIVQAHNSAENEITKQEREVIYHIVQAKESLGNESSKQGTKDIDPVLLEKCTNVKPPEEELSNCRVDSTVLQDSQEQDFKSDSFDEDVEFPPAETQEINFVITSVTSDSQEPNAAERAKRKNGATCDLCHKTLSSVAALNIHKLVHTEDRPFECTVCKASFKNRAGLKEHQNTHAEPSFPCNICGKKLQSRRTLSGHMAVHSDEMNLKCDVCFKRFKRSKYLKSHLLSHTGLRPYICDVCEKPFACRAKCHSHMLKKHPEEDQQMLRAKLSARLNLPTLEELRAMTHKLRKEKK